MRESSEGGGKGNKCTPEVLVFITLRFCFVKLFAKDDSETAVKFENGLSEISFMCYLLHRSYKFFFT